MAISPPSDIVLDVAKAADPIKLQAAAEKLSRIAAGGDAGATANFAAVMDAARGGMAKPVSAAGPSPSTVLTNLQRRAASVVQGPSDAASHGGTAPTTAQMKAYKGLEAVFLQTYVEAMLPQNEGFFGDASAGNVCRSFLAQQLATQLAKSGSIGLAKTLFAAHAPAESTAGIAQQSQALATSGLAGSAGNLAGLLASGRSSTRRL